MSGLELVLLEAEVGLALYGRVEVSWSTWLAAAEGFHTSLCVADQNLLGTPRDILNRWALNGTYFMELDEVKDRLRICAMDWPSSTGAAP